MQLQEVFDQLTYGEFSQLSIGGQAAGVIDEHNYPNVIAHVNLGLTALFTRFHLRENQLLLALQTGQTNYRLHSSFAVNVRRSQEPVRYIKDTAANPFVDDVLKVTQVLTDGKLELGLNNAADAYAVSTPSMASLTVPVELVTDGADIPDELVTENLTVVYRANHPKLAVGMGCYDPSRVEIQLPDSHLTALLYFVASRVNNPIGMTNEFHAGNSFAAKYEAECQGLEGRGIQVDQGAQNTRLELGGWV